jgi:cytochrome c biogenesis protein CcmG, thiol:disulfide interchange protein DsbE
MLKKFLFLLTGILFYCSAKSQNPGSKVHKLPSSEVKTLEGKSVNTSSFSNEDKPIIISFWATWCKPCVNELTAIADNYIDWKKETGVKVIAVSIDDSRNMAKVAPFVNGKNWDYEVYIDPNGDFKRAMNVNNIPHTFLLNGKGEIVWQHNSYSPGDEEKLYQNVQKVVAGQPVTE